MLFNNKDIFEIIFNNTEDAIFVLEGVNIVKHNRTALEMFGCTPGDFAGKTPFDFSPRLQPDGSASGYLGGTYVSKALGGEPCMFEWVHSRRDGAHFHAEVSLKLLKYEGASLLLASVRDISWVKKNEQASKIIEKRYQQIVDNSPIAIFQRDLDGKFTYCNKAQVKFFDCKTLDEFSENYSNLKAAWECPEQYEALKAQILEQKEVHNHEVKVKLKNDKVKYLAMSAFLNDQEISGFATDITERKLGELALMKSEERFQQVTTLSGHIVYEMDLSDYSIFWGGAVESITGYTHADFARKNYGDWLDMIHPDERHNRNIFFESFIKKEVLFHIEYRFKTLAGNYIWLEDECFIVEEQNGVPARVLGVMKNINQRKILERQVLNSIIKTEQKERLSYSEELHDGLGPILSAIKIYIQWLRMPDAKRPVEDIVADIEKLVEDAIETVRDISFKLSPHVLKNYGMYKALHIYIERIKKTSFIEIVLTISNERRLSEVVETICYRVLCECINNTIKYARASRIDISINIENNILDIDYTDNGVGFDALNKGNINGLGFLSMESRLKSIGGVFSMKSKPGEGVNIAFRIDLSIN